jgi:uncharacterized damage-inducible protein DinB
MSLMPGPVKDEREGLLTFLAAQRDALKAAVFGLDREQVTSAPSASALNLGGLIKHVANVERFWITSVLAQQPLPEMDYDGAFTLSDDETVEGTLALYDEVAAETESIVNALPGMDVPVPVPKGVPWFPQDVDAWSARWVLLHLIQETTRHAGHADIIRETIDGSNAFVLLAKSKGLQLDYLAAYDS